MLYDLIYLALLIYSVHPGETIYLTNEKIDNWHCTVVQAIARTVTSKKGARKKNSY